MPTILKDLDKNPGILSIEYLHNSNLTDGSNSVAFSYGSQGAQFGTMTGQQFKRVSWITPLNPGDSMEIEMSEDSGLHWTPFNNLSMTCAWTLQTTTVYGIQLTNITATTADLYFGLYRNVATAAYGGAGYAWTGLSIYRWRVKKTSYRT